MDSADKKNEFLSMDGENVFSASKFVRELKALPDSSVRAAIFETIMSGPKIQTRPADDCDCHEIFVKTGTLPGMIITLGRDEAEDVTPALELPPVDVTVTVPINGRPLKDLLQKTGLASLEDIIERFKEIAAEENVQILIGDDDDKGEVIINMSKKDRYTRQKRMQPANEDFIEHFKWEVI
jgi:hypothetical protein